MAIILQISHADDTGKTEDAKFIALCQVNSSIQFMPKEVLFHKVSFHV